MTKPYALLKISFAILLAIATGAFVGPKRAIAGIPIVHIFDLIGELFLNALTLVVIPLVAASIITGTARMGKEGSFGSLGIKIFFYFILTSSIAILCGYAAVTLIAPGSGLMIIDPAFKEAKLNALMQLSEQDSFAKISAILLRLIPPNILSAAAEGQMIGLIPFCLLFGYYMTKIETSLSTVLISFWQALFQVMMQITYLIMRALPIGVFALVAKVVALSGIHSFWTLIWFSIAVVSALALYVGLFLPILLISRGISPFVQLKAMAPALFTAFSTSSSAATLPIAIECAEESLGISNRISSLVLPLGSSINLSATALYECVVVFFIAQAYEIPLSLPQQAIILLMSLLTSIGMAGIPSASLIAIVIILKTVGLPIEGIGLVVAVERILDMLRTTVNVFGSSCCASLIAASEGENLLSNKINVSTPATQGTLSS